MFAFALWDRQARVLRLVRDRLGVKPLYWSWCAGVMLFGSELKALMAHPSWRGEVDEGSAAALIRYGYVPGEATIFRDVHKLPPASILTLAPDGVPRIECYWRLRDVARQGLQDQIGDEEAAREQLEALLKQSIAGRMISDVPLGAFLSGGVDSSTVVALMQAASNRKVRTFSIGFHDAAYNEAEQAKAVAAHLGTDHTEMYATAQDALDVIPDIPAWFDEPFADSSQIPTYLVSSMTRRHVTVALSGDGGDELFAGYPKYQEVDRLWRCAAMVPSFVRSGAAAALNTVPQSLL
jgi:asparagine synthase (glutamine-hydrolysing)